MLAEAFPRAPVIAVICDNDSIHHGRAVLAYLKDHPPLELLYGARYSAHDNLVERIWAALKNYVANTARSPSATSAATSLPPGPGVLCPQDGPGHPWLVHGRAAGSPNLGNPAGALPAQQGALAGPPQR